MTRPRKEIDELHPDRVMEIAAQAVRVVRVAGRETQREGETNTRPISDALEELEKLCWARGLTDVETTRRPQPMRFQADPRLAEEIHPGEAFSTLGPEHWDRCMANDPLAIGQRVYLRTHAPVPAEERGETFYVITALP